MMMNGLFGEISGKVTQQRWRPDEMGFKVLRGRET